MPVAGASVTIDGSLQAQSATDGSFSVETTSPAPTTSRVSVSASGYLTREAQLSWTADATVDLIQDGGPFSLTFYRQLVRNTFDHPETLQPLRRWTRAPMVYLKTQDEAREPIPVSQLDSVEAVLRETAPLLTNGRFGLAGVERGTETKAGLIGWITVVWASTTDPERSCGRAGVGTEGSTITLYYKQGGGCSCGSLAIRPRTVRHELGHALGFWHTDSTGDLMSGIGVAGCDGSLSARERFHANVSYSRQPGNTDIDNDPRATMQSLQSGAGFIEVVD